MHALFSNIQGQYWSGTTEAAFKTTNFLHGWAVDGGDVAAVPAPGSVWLLGTGLVGAIGLTRRKLKRFNLLQFAAPLRH